MPRIYGKVLYLSIRLIPFLAKQSTKQLPQLASGPIRYFEQFHSSKYCVLLMILIFHQYFYALSKYIYHSNPLGHKCMEDCYKTKNTQKYLRAYLYAGNSGLAIITDSKWNLPSPRYTSADKSLLSFTRGEVQPKISPGDRGFDCGTIIV